MTRLSVNINKIATLRNARGGNLPDVIKAAKFCERFGAEGITVHPRPDERHIRYQDVRELKEVVTTEFNVEGYPSEDFLALVEEVRPHQVTLVPDPPDATTSSEGWDTVNQKDFLIDVIQRLKSWNIRTSIFVDTNPGMMEGASETGADRVELYTGPYAEDFGKNPQSAIQPYVRVAEQANEQGLGVNAGHDLNLENLRYFKESIPGLLEVSIGHALISDALYFGLENTINMYNRELR